MVVVVVGPTVYDRERGGVETGLRPPPIDRRARECMVSCARVGRHLAGLLVGGREGVTGCACRARSARNFF